MGTAAYMAPEQAEGKPLDQRSDIFSFGAVLYEMLSGNRAFRGGSMAQVLRAALHEDPARGTTGCAARCTALSAQAAELALSDHG